MNEPTPRLTDNQITPDTGVPRARDAARLAQMVRGG